MKKDIQIICPYCGSIEVDCVDNFNFETDLRYVNGSFSHSLYSCNNEECDETFYVAVDMTITKVEVSKEKWENYQTVYENEDFLLGGSK